MRLTASGCSERGPRPTNQDRYFCDVELGLFAVADGMGGHQGGEVAARTAVDAVVEFVKMSRDSRDLTWPSAYDASRSPAANRVDAAMRLANQHVHRGGARDPNLTGMGTTLIVVLIEGNRLVVGHVGDSRAYRLRAGQFGQVTRDDTWLTEMLGIDAASPGAASHPMRHILTSGIGMRPDVTPTLIEEQFAAGDQWLLCTDGVHGYVQAGALQTALQAPSCDAAAERVVQLALDAGTADNATAIVIRIE